MWESMQMHKLRGPNEVIYIFTFKKSGIWFFYKVVVNKAWRKLINHALAICHMLLEFQRVYNTKS